MATVVDILPLIKGLPSFRAHQTHYEQMGRIEGTVVVDGHAYILRLDSMRDHSYGKSRAHFLHACENLASCPGRSLAFLPRADARGPGPRGKGQGRALRGTSLLGGKRLFQRGNAHFPLNFDVNINYVTRI